MKTHFRKIIITVALLTAPGFLASCSGRGKPQGPPLVFVSIPPQKYFVDRIAGDRAQTRILIAPGQSPHTYTPTPRQIADLSRASVYFTIGIPFEGQIAKKAAAQNRSLRIEDMGRGVDRADAVEHDHEHGHHEEHGELDPHIWMSPRNAVSMAENTAAVLSVLDPENRETYEKNKESLIADLRALDQKLSAMFEPFKGQRFYVYHPAFGYFAHAYGLEQIAVETGGKEPAARTLDALIRKARADGVRVIFVQPQFSKKSADRVAREIGGVVIPLDGLAEDYIANMEIMAREIVSGFSR
jgi:zinc transport system substrate-binding protein